jgi:hypothetical protein
MTNYGLGSRDRQTCDHSDGSFRRQDGLAPGPWPNPKTRYSGNRRKFDALTAGRFMPFLGIGAAPRSCRSKRDLNRPASHRIGGRDRLWHSVGLAAVLRGFRISHLAFLRHRRARNQLILNAQRLSCSHETASVYGPSRNHSCCRSAPWRHRARRAEAGRLRILRQQQRTSGATSLRQCKCRCAAAKGNCDMPGWQI